jgi:RNA polymerase sigma-70 factor (ECF subfamily)
MDAAALEAFVGGDQAAFEALFREHQREVYAWIVRLVRDPAAAEDLTIETFWRIYRSRARFDPSRSFGAWARRIAVNVAIDHLNRAGADRARFAPLEDADGAAGPARPAASRTAAPAADRDARRSIVRAFLNLPATLRVTARLALVDERPYQEIAELLGVSVGAVKSRVFRATRLLRDELAEWRGSR